MFVPRFITQWVCWVWLFALVACGEDKVATQLLVTVRLGTAEQGADVRWLRVDIDRGGGVVTSLEVDLEKKKSLPASFGVLPKAGDDPAGVTLKAMAYASKNAGAVAILSSRARTVMFKEHQRIAVELVLGEDASDGGLDGALDDCTAVADDCVVLPSYVPLEKASLLYADDTAEVTLPAAVTVNFDTDTGLVEVVGQDLPARPAGEGVDAASGVGFEVVPTEDGGPNLGVFYMRALTVPDGTRVELIGTNAAVFLVRGPVIIVGGMDGGGRGMTGGPGGRDGRRKFESNANPLDGNSPGAGPTDYGIGVHCGFGGGGGGAGGSAGGAGGVGNKGPAWTADDPYFPGGPAGSAALDDILRGGGGGGAGYGCAGHPVHPGGGGGGALLIASATTIHLMSGAILRMPGGGGQTRPEEEYYGAGSGGGAGGMIVLEAPQVAVDGTLAVNGGGGAAGDSSTFVGSAASFAGARGGGTTIQAKGGVTSSTNAWKGGVGGPGAAGDEAAGPGGDGATTDASFKSAGPGGGGGGGAGRIVIRAVGGQISVDRDAVLTPSIATGLTHTDGAMRIGRLP